jgi:hypothetical protein
MTDLIPEDEALIRQARIGLEPTSDDRDRVRRKAFTRLGLGVAAATATISATGTTAGAVVVGGSVGAVVSNIVAAVLVVGSLAGGHVAVGDAAGRVAVSRPAGIAASAVPRSATIPTAGVSAAPLETMPLEEPSAPQPVPEAVPIATPVVISRAHASPPAHVAPSPVTIQPSASHSWPGPETVAREASLLRDADAALRAGDAGRALALLDEHTATFPGGVLAQERSAERVIVLCALGRTTEARRAAAAFLIDHPSSPLVSRVRGACASP